MPSTSTAWSYFMPVTEIPAEFAPGGGKRIDRYLVHEVRSICGEVPSSLRKGMGLARIESGSPIHFSGRSRAEPPGGFPLRGVVQHLHYTARSERSELEKISLLEPDRSAETMAVLIPIGKSPAWWRLSQDER